MELIYYNIPLYNTYFLAKVMRGKGCTYILPSGVVLVALLERNVENVLHLKIQLINLILESVIYSSCLFFFLAEYMHRIYQNLFFMKAKNIIIMGKADSVLLIFCVLLCNH